MKCIKERKLSAEEKEIFKVIKILRKDDYAIKDYLKAINKIKRQEQERQRLPSLTTKG